MTRRVTGFALCAIAGLLTAQAATGQQIVAPIFVPDPEFPDDGPVGCVFFGNTVCETFWSFIDGGEEITGSVVFSAGELAPFIARGVVFNPNSSFGNASVSVDAFFTVPRSVRAEITWNWELQLGGNPTFFRLQNVPPPGDPITFFFEREAFRDSLQGGIGVTLTPGTIYRLQMLTRTIGVDLSGDNFATVNTEVALFTLPCRAGDIAEPMGTADFFDVATFLNDFEDDAPEADWNRDGTVDNADIPAYLSDFDNGCV